MRQRVIPRLAALLGAAVVLAACAGAGRQPPGASHAAAEPRLSAALEAREMHGPEGQARLLRSSDVLGHRETGSEAEAERRPEIDLGTGTFVTPQPEAPPPVSYTEGGDVALNFAGADVREVAEAVLGRVLDLNYAVSPQVEGTVTMRTSRPLRREAVLPAFESVLQLVGAAIVPSRGVYKVVPLQEAVRQATSIRVGTERVPRNGNYGIRIVPLEYVSAREMQRILEPVATPGAVIRADPARNLLILAGTGPDTEALLGLVDTFDVDWLKGMSFGLFPLKFAQAKDVVAELEKIVGAGEEAPLAGVLRFVPIERLNAVLVISPQREYVTRMEKWVSRLDSGNDQADRRLFVYYVQNGRASDIAAVLGEAFSGKATGANAESEAGPEVAPTLEPVTMRTPARPSAQQASAAQPGGRGAGAGQAPSPTAQEARQESSGLQAPGRSHRAQAAATAVTFKGEQEVRVIADETNNALVVLATAADYRMVEAALEKLDIPPLQVLVEATIAEVSLNNDLRYGVQWFFKRNRHSFTLSEFESGAVSSIFPGFSYVLNSSDIRVVLNALDEITNVKVISSPQLMVLDNRTARLQVGDQVPVVTQQAQSVTDATAPVVNTVSQRDTGVILHVTPHVNTGGLVIMDIEQEVSDVVKTTTSGIDSPTIQTRKISSSIAVQSGQTVALGGLIRDRGSNQRQGLPLLHDIPILGNLFGATANSSQRTELLVLLTPRVAGTQREARAVTQELRQRLRDVEPLLDKVR